jgi:hypothetical protein
VLLLPPVDEEHASPAEETRLESQKELPLSVISRSQRGMAAAMKLHDEIRLGSSKIIKMALDGSRIDDDSPKPAKWKDRHYRVAKDARKPLKERPIYLQIALDNHKAYIAADSNKDMNPQLNANVVNVYVDQRVYDVKDVKS